MKASIAERVNRTLKSKVFKYMTSKNTRKYIDILPDIVGAYNKTYHRSIKMTPAAAMLRENANTVRKNLFPPKKKIKKNTKFKLNDIVRVSHARGAFQKSYLPLWSLEVFKIAKVIKRTDPVMYKLRDLAGEDIKGGFYEDELQLIDVNLDEEKFEIEKIIKSRLREDGRREYFVKFLSYPAKFNQWVTDISNIS